MILPLDETDKICNFFRKTKKTNEPITYVVFVYSSVTIMSSTHHRDIHAAAAASTTGGLRGVIAGKIINYFKMNKRIFFSRWYNGWY